MIKLVKGKSFTRTDIVIAVGFIVTMGTVSMSITQFVRRNTVAVLAVVHPWTLDEL